MTDSPTDVEVLRQFFKRHDNLRNKLREFAALANDCYMREQMPQNATCKDAFNVIEQTHPVDTFIWHIRDLTK